MLYVQLSQVFFRIGLFTIGGGYAMLPLIQEEVVGRGWLTNEAFADILAISEVTPGAFAVNMATFVGFRMAAVWGAVAATLALALPSILIVTAFGHHLARARKQEWFTRTFTGIRPAVTGTIAAAAVSLGRTVFLTDARTISDLRGPAITAGIIVLLIRKVHPIYTLLIAGAAGWIVFR